MKFNMCVIDWVAIVCEGLRAIISQVSGYQITILIQIWMLVTGEALQITLREATLGKDLKK